MVLTVKWLSRFSPIAVYEDGQILGYKKGWLYKINEKGDFQQICKMANSIVDQVKESIRVLVRLFRRDIKASCILETGEVYFFRSKILYKYNDKTHSLTDIVSIPQGKSTPLSIAPALKGTGYIVLWGDYCSNADRKEVNVWGLTDNKNVEIVYQFPAASIRHIHNIVPDVRGNGYYIFTGDNDEKAGIYYADALFENVEPIFIGNQQARAVQGFCIENGIIYATDSVTQRNYIFTLKKDAQWKQNTVCPINGSCIYACSRKDKVYFSTTVESPETEGQNHIVAMLSTKRGSGILSERVEVVSVDRRLNYQKEMEFTKDALPYKLFQYGAVMFPASKSENLVIYPVGVKKYDGRVGIVHALEVGSE